MKNKKHCAVVMATTGNMAFALGNVLIGLKKYSPDLADDIIIFSNDLKPNDKKALKSIFPNRIKIKKFAFDLKSENNQEAINVFTSMAYSKYECFNLLDKYENIIWLDCDVLIKKDISGILEYGQKTGVALRGGISERATKGNFFPGADKLIDFTGGFGCNSGVFVLNDKLPRYNEIAKWCYEKTILLKDYLLAADQGIISLTIPHFKLTCTALPPEYNIFSGFVYFYPDTRIEHCYGPEKFWNFFDDKEWYENYRHWLILGGSKGETKRLSVFEKMVYQKSLKNLKDHELYWGYFFIDHLKSKYGEDAVIDAYLQLQREILKNQFHSNDEAFDSSLRKNFQYFSSNFDYSEFMQREE